MAGIARSFKGTVMKHNPSLRIGLGILASTTLLLAGCSSDPEPTAAPSTPQTSSPATPAAAQTVGEVPWSQVGPGWVLAVWSPVTPHHPGEEFAPGEPTPETSTNVLYLVDPAGKTYSIAEFPPGEPKPDLVEWSGDGSHALFTSRRAGHATAISIDLRTGERTTVAVDGSPAYTRPNGEALLVSTSFNGDAPGTLTRIGMDGKQQLAYPTADLGGAGRFSGDYLETPDGTQLVLGTASLGNEVVPRTDNSLVVVNNDGTIARTLPVPMPNAYCAPVKWWAADVMLTHCTIQRGGGEQLWEVPIDGGTPTALTAVNTHEDAPGFEGNYGNWNAFVLPSGTYLPTAGACGTSYVSKLTADGHTQRVDIPDVSDSVGLVGTTGDTLLIVAQVGCGGGQSMLTYDPVANTTKVLLGPPDMPGGIESARLYPDGK